MEIALGIDGGGTRTRVLAVNLQTGATVMREGAGSNLSRDGEAIVEGRLRALVGEVLEQWALPDLRGADAAQISVAGGFAGAGRSGARDLLTRMLRNIASTNRVRVVTDAQVALYAASLGGPGAVLIAGTGTIAYAESARDGTAYDEAARGESARNDGASGGSEDAAVKSATAGGFGYLLGDEGSGFDLGRKAISHTLKALEGRAPAGEVAEGVLALLHARDRGEVLERVYAGEEGRSRIAEAARTVFSAAGAGDVVAKRWLQDAAHEHDRLLTAVIDRLALDPVHPISVAGGLYFEGSPLRELLVRERAGRQDAGQSGPMAFVEGRTACGALYLALEALGFDREACSRWLRAVNPCHAPESVISMRSVT